MIRYNEKQNKTRFIESLDTVRHDPTKAEDEISKRELHANIEVLFSLLFGEQIVVSEPQSFDSLGFLNIATNIIESRPPRSNDSPVYNPFILALMPDHKSYTEMIASRFRKDTFILSGWPDITNNTSKREDIASLIEYSNFSGAKNFGRDKIKQLDTLNNYFIEEEQIISTKVPNIPLKKYLEHLYNMNVDELPQSSNLGYNHKERVLELKDAAKELKNHEIDLSNRSSLHQQGKDILENDVLEGLLDYSNSCYNRVVADSVKADTSVFSTSEKGENDYVLSANALADHAMIKMSRKNILTGRSYLSINPNPDLIKQFEEFKFEKLWKDEIWDILIQDEFIKSVNHLNKKLREYDILAKNALSDHITILSKKLPFIKESEKGWIKVLGGLISIGIGSIGGAIAGGILGDTIEGGDSRFAGAIGGAIGGMPLGSYCSQRINKWWVESTIWSNIADSVKIRGFPNLNP